MKTLRVTLADLEGIPHGSAPAATRAEITAAYTGVVALTDGTLIPNAIKAKQAGGAGVVNFSVYPSDSPDVREEYRGFGVTVTAKVQSLNGTTVTARRTVVVPDSSPSTVHLGNLAPADPLPPQWTTVDEVIGDFDARLDSLEDHPVDHAARHATGGGDPVTPASIGALQANSTSRTGAGEDLDLIVAPGRYAVGPSAINTPVGSAAHLDVWDRASANLTYQRFMGIAGPGIDQVWVRSKIGAASWSMWKRIDAGAVTPESIGAVPADDPRLLDTGWRDMPADEWIASSAFPDITHQRLRRVGNTVWVGLRFAYEADKFSYRTTATPLGFRPDISAFSAPVMGYTGEPIQIGVFGVNSSGTTFLRTRPGIASSVNGFFTTSWLTSDRWPTTLPGTPV